jgi:hypothetical protein
MQYATTAVDAGSGGGRVVSLGGRGTFEPLPAVSFS